MPATIGRLGYALLALAGATLTFVLETVIMDQIPDAVVVAAALVGAALVVAAAYGSSTFLSVSDWRKDAEVVSAAATGVLVFWAAPLFALSQRATDSPSGADTAMLTTAAWGALVVIASWVGDRRTKPSVAPAAGFAALFGAAAILANWERPSSLNLFVKATERELLIVAAGMVFAIGAVRLCRSMARLGAARASVVSIGAAAIVGTLFALPSAISSLPSLGTHVLSLTLLGLSYGAFCLGWLRSSRDGVEVAAISLLLVPLALTALSVVERRVGVAGPNPIVWAGVFAGAALCLSAATTLVVSDREVRIAFGGLGRSNRAVFGVALAAVLLGGVSLFLPAIRATSEGSLGDGFHASWEMLGFETTAGWMPLVASLLALAALVDLLRRARRMPSIAAAVTALVACFTVPALSAVPLHTWTTWIPPDVQQTYGTEYARLITEPLVSPVAISSLALAGVASCAVIILALRGDSVRGGADISEEGT